MMGHFLTRLGVYTANPLAFLVLIVYAALWIVFKPETFEWHAVATLATWAMTLVIQRAEHRDTKTEDVGSRPGAATSEADGGDH